MRQRRTTFHGQCQWRRETQSSSRKTDFDTSKPEDARLLCLEVLVNLVRTVTVDVRLLHQRERHAVVELAELRDLGV